MNKNTQIQRINGNESNTKKKNKFNKFFTTVSAVMIASSIALSPMTLRADDTDKKEIKTVQDANEKLVDGMKKIKKKAEKMLDETREEIKEIDKKIEQNNKEIEESKKREMEAKRQEMEATLKLLEQCNQMKNMISKGKDYCSKNKCTEEEIKKMEFGINIYKEKCEKLIVKSE